MSAALQGPSGRILLETNPVTIGYTPDNALVVNSSQISLVSAIIMARGRGYTITAVSEVRAVIIDGQQLALHLAHWLHPGASIWIGETMFRYEEDRPASSTPIPDTLAVANPYVYDADNEATVTEAANATRDVQAGSMHIAPSRAEASVDQKLSVPISPPPVTSGSSGAQWPQYQVSGDSLYSTPLTPPPPFVTQPQAQPPGSTVPLSGQSNVSVPVQRQNKIDPLKLLLIALVVVLVLIAGGSGVFIYQLTRPQPIIALTSQYMQGYLPVSATNTSLHVLGYRFSYNSPITFLLDNQSMTGISGVHSDENGNFQANLSITSAWSIGLHKLTAKDGDKYLATNVDSIRIVNQGEANTPGPSGAPPDDSTFPLKVTTTQTNSSSSPIMFFLTVLGLLGHDSATVCNERIDNDQQWTSNGTAQGGLTYNEVDTYSCKGIYKGGKLNYTEMLVSSKVTYSNGSSCRTASSVIGVQLLGSFNSATTISGTYQDPGYSLSCTPGLSSRTINIPTTLGTWTGSVA